MYVQPKRHVFPYGASDSNAALLLAGCTTSTGSMSDIYLFSVSYSTIDGESNPSSSIFGQAAESGDIVVRAGYFGLCAQPGSTGVWTCASGQFGIRSVLARAGMDPLNAIDVAAHFRKNVVFPGLL